MSGWQCRRPMRRRDLLKMLGLAGPASLLLPALPARTAEATLTVRTALAAPPTRTAEAAMLARTVEAALPVRSAEAAPESPAEQADDDPYRLPRTVVPDHYALTIAPDFGTSSFAGDVTISLQVQQPTREIVLNAAELEIVEAYLLVPSGARLDGTVTLQPDLERARIAFAKDVQPGQATLSLRFGGRFNEQLRGLYLASSEGSDGVTRVMATNQFESADARRAFPCWDEPDFKATFDVTLVVDPGLTAISNGAVLSETPRDDGKVAVVFATSPRMSTYLVALSVGPLVFGEPRVVDGVPIRLAQLTAAPELDEVALEVGAFALHHFNEYFGIPYPAAKLDLIAVPDFAAGAMENFGAISFNEATLLVDAESASQTDLQEVALTVSHEISHQWFGNLVTMRWWNGLWLNEAFATLMENLAVDAYRPEWQVWVSFGFERAEAMAIDALASTRPIEFPVHAPSEAEDMFDAITYEKGGSVLRMLEQHLGPAAFQRGVSTYLRAHSFGNAETTDLWDAIEAATGQPTRALMDSWVFQPGFPLLSVELAANGRQVTLSQRRFMYLAEDDADAGARWQIPVILRFGGAGEPATRSILLTADSTTVDLPDGADWVVANAGGYGFYRVRYAADLLRKLTANLHQTFDTIERFNLVDDTWAAVVAGLTPVAEFLDLARLFRDEVDRTVWVTVLDPLASLALLLPPGQRPAMHAFVRDLIRPATDRLGWDARPDEPEPTGALRSSLLYRLAIYGDDQPAQARFRDLHAAYLADHAAVDPELVPSAVAVTAYTGGAADFDLFVARAKSAPTPQERNQYLNALALFRDRELIGRALALTLTDEVRTARGPALLGSLLQSPEGGDLAWAFIKEHWDAILGRFAPSNLTSMVAGLPALSTPELAADVEQFFTTHTLDIGARPLEQALERLRINVAFRQREAPNVAAYFR